MGFTGIGLDGEYIEKPEDKNDDESEDEEVENESVAKESKESWNRWKPACFLFSSNMYYEENQFVIKTHWLNVLPVCDTFVCNLFIHTVNLRFFIYTKSFLQCCM